MPFIQKIILKGFLYKPKYNLTST